ncbi:MAG: dialkylresorcinol condensing enzyme [Acidiferrobacteraceae bacterium]|jgi:hypothetical protein
MPTSASAPKRVLIVQYSQSGQLTRVTENVCRPLLGTDAIETTFVTLEPAEPFPFPWPFLGFFNIFPECVYGDAPPLKPTGLCEDDRFDLIIFAYQVWFLSPSLPATAFLKSDVARAVFRDTPVVTLVACRNMWTQAHLAMTRMLDSLGAKRVDNVVLTDPSPAMASFITTPRWVLTGRKNAFWGFPAAGLSEQQIADSERFGKAIVDGLKSDRERSGAPLLNGLGAVTANVSLIQSEKIGYRSFRIWGKLLRKIGDQSSIPRRIVLLLYIVFLVCMIITVVPLTMVIRRLLQSLLRTRFQELKTSFELPSGSGTERMEEFS